MLERFVEHSPMAIMARLVMQCAIDDQWLDAADLDEDAEREPLREALLACVADAVVAIGEGLRPGARAVMAARFGPSVTALHDRMSRLRAGWGRALVRDGTALLQPLATRHGGAAHEWTEAACGLRVRVLDGDALPSALACTPGPDGCVHAFDGADGGGGLPPGMLPVYDPEYGMVADLVPYQRGRAQEREFVASLLESVQPGELWIVDGRFSTAAILAGWPRGSGLFVIREHGCAPAWQAQGEPREAGLLDGGRLVEQPVAMLGDAAGDAATIFRRVEWLPDAPGQEPIGVLTNAPAGLLDAARIVRLARARWSDTLPLRAAPMFDAALYGDVAARALPLARGILATAYNVFSVMTGAVSGELALDTRDAERLPAHIAAGVRAAYLGMMIALPPAWWQRYDHLSIGTLGTLLRLLAHHLDPRSERRRRREHSISAKSRTLLRTATLDRLLHDDNDDLTSNVFSLRTVAMATRDFSSNPSKALRHASEALVMVTKYNRPIALLVSIEDWNRLLGEVRETSVSRLSLDGGGPVQRVPAAGYGEVPLN
ncbi:type II toxin-antitoxin system Phd/YefM family antitoxin [Burkholderia sp. A1]|uniref:type II toxin-antitoxin system Phd/YefM family antitoxin n=1 Tax=Burkholderia sp. A1 TaxID=148446 RepID=UPI0012698115|nr:type II toxin-antitoxin system Phd/YefM family antitoxin [Burkholderia sp. A1]